MVPVSIRNRLVAAALTRHNGGAGVHTGSYHNAGAFGEVALMYNCPRSATIVSVGHGAVWALVRHTHTYTHTARVTDTHPPTHTHTRTHNLFARLAFEPFP